MEADRSRDGRASTRESSLKHKALLGREEVVCTTPLASGIVLVAVRAGQSGDLVGELL